MVILNSVENKMKGVKVILTITKQEKDKLLSMGVKYGENGIVHTTSKHSGKTYFVTESRKNMEKLNTIRSKY